MTLPQSEKIYCGCLSNQNVSHSLSMPNPFRFHIQQHFKIELFHILFNFWSSFWTSDYMNAFLKKPTHLFLHQHLRLNLEPREKFWYVYMNSLSMFYKYMSYWLIDIWIKNREVSGLGKSDDLGTRLECEFLEYKKIIL